MESLSKFKQQFRRSPAANNGDTIQDPDMSSNLAEPNGDPEKPAKSYEVGGIAKLEAAHAVWGRNGKYFLYFGEVDNVSTSSYITYASSSFNQLSKVATVTTATGIILAIVKPPIAKISDVLGRAEAYIFTTTCYVLGYILCASSTTFNTYAGGYVFYALGQGGTSLLDSVMVSDLSNMRWRGFSYNIIYLPFLITPWVGALIVDGVVDRIGWRWGIGMFAILMPFTASFIIITLLVFQRRARKAGFMLTQKLTLYEFCSQIDLGGIFLLGGGFAMLLIPITLAAATTSRWKTPWIDTLMALGVVSLTALYPYERYIAKHPVVPVRYFTNLSIVVSVALGILDNMGFGITHTYLYAWSLVSHNYSARNAIYLAYTNGVMQCLTGMAIGLVMYKTRSFKWLGVAGAAIRLIGYGVMIRLRTNESSMAELFIVQVVQGLGSGIIETIIIVGAQIVIPHAELAQVTSLISLSAFLGNGIGSAIAGGIYTDTLRERLRFRLNTTNQTEIDSMFDSITDTLPLWDTPARTAVNEAYSDVMGYMTIAALALSAPVLIVSFFMPNNKLGDGLNLYEATQSQELLEVTHRTETQIKESR
ncbi:hypothetical protein ZTR_07043 [Talaromyces verruculosus]|nr:hypothetical protein ZTR_07043 [Talaromyces verruculosus]